MKITRTLGVRRIKVEDISGLKHHSCLLTAAGMCGREWAQGWPVKLSCVGGRERNLVKTRNKTAETRGPGRLAAWPAWAGKMCQQWLVAGDLGVATGAGLLFESRPAALAGEGSP